MSGVAANPETPSAANTAPQWIQTEMNGVSIGCWQPPGWLIDTTDGLLLAEHTLSLATGEPSSGMMVYVFVPQVEHLDVVPEDTHNFALAVLSQIVTSPEHMGTDVAVSEPQEFQWGAHHAAYYLITSGDGYNMVVIGIALPDDHERLVVINAAIPAAQSALLRPALPRILNDLMIDGVEMDVTALGGLPNPLDFPIFPHA